MLWQQWWLWLSAGALLGVLEMLAPGFILLGFALGAVLVGLLLWFGAVSGGSLSALLLIFAFASLAAWVGLKRIFGARSSEKTVWHRDINED
ncbi:MAG: hypothetical protein R3D84_16885 [Paracoccaceae bacterium]